MPQDKPDVLDFIKYIGKSAKSDLKRTGDYDVIVDDAKELAHDALACVKDFCEEEIIRPLKSNPEKDIKTPPPQDHNTSIQGPASFIESAFLEPQNAGALYNVTKLTPPEIKTKSVIFPNVKWRIRGFEVRGSYEQGSTHYSLFAGRKCGFGISQNGDLSTTDLKLVYKPLSKKAQLTITNSTVARTVSGSIYYKKGNLGGDVSYNNSCFSAGISADKNGAALSAGFLKDYSDGTHVEVKGYVSTQKDARFGVTGVIYFNP